MAEKYAIRDLAEAYADLRDPILRAHYEEITAAVRDQLAKGIALEDLMGSRIDALKLVSSLTLFRAAAERLVSDGFGLDSMVRMIDSVLTQAAAFGFPPYARTRDSL